MVNGKIHFLKNLGISWLFLFFLLCIHLYSQQSVFWVHTMGIRPGSYPGLSGIITAPFFHGSWTHLLSNTIPFFILLNVCLNLYSSLMWRVLPGIWLISGVMVWLVGDSGTSHLGISGLIYGLVGFLLTAGLLGRNKQSYRLSIIVALLYGGFWWGFLPVPGISWESHVFGFLSGILMAITYHKILYVVPEQKVEMQEFDYFFQEVDWRKQRASSHPESADLPE